ncbi:MAG: GNAT family protein [Chitinophagales bacterium]|nr:GNAT family N-acetyltransferase [Bacteroidota bacterium]MCB9043275.1 GNAT family N-acetyltransferase [Chitinophagales bacterium]
MLDFFRNTTKLKGLESVALKPIATAHVGEIYSLIQESLPNLQLWLPWASETLLMSDTEAFIKDVKGRNFYLARQVYEIWFEGKIAGLIDLHNGNRETQTVEIGYWLGTAYQGKGIMLNACKILLRKVFAHTKISCVYVRCAENNLRSRSIPEKLRFTDLGYDNTEEIINTQKHKMLKYSLTKKQWERDLIFYA